MIAIENPFAGRTVGWTWAQHRAQGYEGGTDYILYPPDKIPAAADGVVMLVPGANGFTPGSALYLHLSDGRTINYREVASALVKTGTKVTRGQAIGNPTKAGRWPHIDATVNGVRVPFEPLVNTGLSTAGSSGTPVQIPQGDDNMIIYTASTASADGVIPAGAVFLQGDSGPLRVMSAPEKQAYDFWNTNGIPYRLAAWTGDQVRAVTRVSGLCQWNPDFTPTGKIVYADPSKADYPKVAGGSSSSSVDLQPVIDQLAAIQKLEATDQAALIAAINALPAEVRTKIVAAP